MNDVLSAGGRVAVFFVLIGTPGPSWEVQPVDVATADEALALIAGSRPEAVTLGAVDADGVTWQQLTRSVSRAEVSADDAMTAVGSERSVDEVIRGQGGLVA